jgi:hypothetical protein
VALSNAESRRIQVISRLAALVSARLGSRRQRLWMLAMLTIAVLGLVHRYHDIAYQIPLGDEWHSLWRASTTPLEKLYRYYPRATAAPINLYQRWLLDSGYGWSELSIRMISIVSTVATFLFLPWGVLRLTGSRVMAAAVLVLFTLSPFWTYYGQNSRPYASYFLLLLASFYFFRRALLSNSAGSWFGFAASGALAVYFHLYALPALGSLSLLSLVRLGALARTDRHAALRLLWGVFCGFAGWALLLGAFFAETLIVGISKKVPAGDKAQSLDYAFFRHFAELLTGCQNAWLGWALIALSLVGLSSLFRKDRYLVAMLGLAAVACSVLTLLVRPRWYFVAIVPLRYNISFFPLYFLGIARLVERAAELANARLRVIPLFRTPERSAVVAVLSMSLVGFFASPLPATLAIRPNNFRQHAAYQEFYGGWDPSRVRASAFFGDVDGRTANDISPFYARFLQEPGSCGVIEFPLAFLEQYIPYYFYQTVHRCEVFAGYSRRDKVGVMMDLPRNRAEMKFRRMVDLEQPDLIRRSGADYVVVHHDIRQEVQRGRRVRISREVALVLEELEKTLGDPVYTDRYLTAFKL